jgi:hypothetical protein
MVYPAHRSGDAGGHDELACRADPDLSLSPLIAARAPGAPSSLAVEFMESPMSRFAERPVTTVDALAVRICQAMRTVRDEHEAWVALDRLAGQPGLESRTQVDAAAAFAGARGWLAFGNVAADRALLLERAP